MSKQVSGIDFILYGGDLKSSPCQQNVGQYFLDQMKVYKDNIAQIEASTDIKYTYNDLCRYSVRCALEMRARGVKKGDIINICCLNHKYTMIPFYASIFLGAPINATHPLYTYNELTRMIKLTLPKMIFCDQEVQPILQKVQQDLGILTEIVTFEDDFDQFISPREDTSLENNFKAEIVDVYNDDIFILCTSGTTGHVKGVTIKHYAYYHSIVDNLVYYENAKVGLYYSPLCWLTALLGSGQMLFKGVTRIVCEYDPSLNLEILKKYKVDWLLFTPLKLTEMIKHPHFFNYPEITENVKMLLYGGSPSNKTLNTEIHKLFKNAFIVNGYGSSECCNFNTTFYPTEHSELYKKKIQSNGKLARGCYAKIADKKTGEILGRNQPGELYIKSYTLTKGYYKNPEATAEAIDADGWFHTGDIVQIDDDDCFYVVGRAKELLKYKGWQVSPSELEEVLGTHPCIETSCVMGKPHVTDGDLPLAFVVLKPGKTVTPEEIICYVNERVTDVQRLRGGVIIIDSLPLSASGKVRRNELTKLISAT